MLKKIWKCKGGKVLIAILGFTLYMNFGYALTDIAEFVANSDQQILKKAMFFSEDHLREFSADIVHTDPVEDVICAFFAPWIILAALIVNIIILPFIWPLIKIVIWKFILCGAFYKWLVSLVI